VYEVRVHEQAQATLDALLAEVIVAYMGVLDVLEVPLGVGSRCVETTQAGTCGPWCSAPAATVSCST
jgi:hypothetical protein